MAQQTTIRLVDDLDGTEADETVEFSLGRGEYVIDLSETNAAKLRAALAEFTAAARRTGGANTRRRRATTVAGDRVSRARVRAWARANNYSIGDRGRIPQAILDAHAASTR